MVVVLPHWGDAVHPHAVAPAAHGVRQLVDAGADLVVGGHPHWVQGMDDVDGVPVIHSLGNFVFDMDFYQEALEGVVLETTWWGEELKAFRLVPYAMEIGRVRRRGSSTAPARILGRRVGQRAPGPTRGRLAEPGQHGADGALQLGQVDDGGGVVSPW